MNTQTPFLDVRSFVSEDGSQDTMERETSVPANSPFLSLYETETSSGLVNPETEEYITFLNELYDEEFDEALYTLVDEATAMYETQFLHEREDPQTVGYQAERFLTQHFAPLVTEVEKMFEALAKEFSQHDLNTLSENEIEALVDRYQPATDLNPAFEEFWGKLKNVVKKVAKVAKKGIAAVASGGLSLILPKLKSLIKPLLSRVIQKAINKLPVALQPIAKKLAERVPFLKDLVKNQDDKPNNSEIYDICEIQHEFNQQVANLLFAPSVVEQDLEIARVLTEKQDVDAYPLPELDRAREQFIENLQHLKEGEDPTPYIENFLPAILPALKIGINLIGRQKIVNFLAKYLGKLIGKFVDPQYAAPLSKAIVDAGLRLIQLEATPEDESNAAASAVAATVEETVQRVAALPDHVLDNQDLLEGFVLEAFEQAAAANLPAILPEETYRKRPDLKEAKKLRGVWLTMPRRKSPKRYKKFSRKIPVKITPHKMSELETFNGASLEEFLEEALGILPGEEVTATMHLYEAIPGTRLSEIARLEENTPGLGATNGYQQLQPLTREAAELLVGEPDLGREIDPESVTPHQLNVGQRFYYLEVPGKKHLTTPNPSGRAKMRNPTRTRLILDFPKNEIRLYLFLSEIRAQEIAVKLRQHTHIGTVAARLGRILERGLRRAFSGGFGRLKIIHEAALPGNGAATLQRLPSLLPQILMGRLQEWVLKAFSDHLKQHDGEFIKAAEDTADGVTILITLGNPPGFPQIRQALKGKWLSPASLKMADGQPVINIRITPGYRHE